MWFWIYKNIHKFSIYKAIDEELQALWDLLSKRKMAEYIERFESKLVPQNIVFVCK